jgi:DNA-binding PadR family transcriptional regulator
VLQGLLKMWMLNVISGEEVCGYEIIQKVGAITGKKPSTGSVYPLLKTMRDDGWIVASNQGVKTVYQVTEQGRRVLERHSAMKDDYVRRISASYYLASETFADLHLVISHNRDLINPLLEQVSKLLANGIQSQRIEDVLNKALMELAKLEDGGKL